MQTFSNHSEVKKLLPSSQQKQSFDRLMFHFVGIAVHNKYDLSEPFPVPIQSLMPYHIHRFIKPLSIFIERVGSYQKGENGENGKCYEYRFKDEFFKSEIVFSDTEIKENAVNYDYNPQAVKMSQIALKGLTIQDLNKHVKTIKQANYHFNKILTASITPQYVGNRLSLNKAKKTIIVKGITLKVADIETFLQRKVKAAQIAGGYILNELRQGQFYCSCSPTNGRVNTSFTSLAEVLTPYIRLQGEKIQGIDISNSQFLLLSHLLENCLPTSNKKLFNFIYGNNYDKHVLGKENGKTYEVAELIRLIEKITLQAEKGSDFETFLNASFNGTLYDTFADTNGISRTTAKTAFFAILFGKCKTSKHAKSFAKSYPSVFEITNKFKDVTHYSILSVFLQKIESLIFIESLLPLCYYSGIQALTKHDSIYSKVSDYKKLLKIVTPFFNALFNSNYDIK